MKPTLRLLSLLFAAAAFGPPRIAVAQTTPTLEFAPGAGNPTSNGPTVANQVITFQNNTNNPTGNTFVGFTPTTQATFSLSNQRYTQAAAKIVTQTGLAFGATITPTGNQLATASALFPALSTVGGSTDGQYTSAGGLTGGISATNPASNNGVELFTSTEPLPATVPANSRYQYADLTITFNYPVINPVVHVTGLGGVFGGGIGFTTELDLISSGVTLSKLNGSTELAVTPNQVLNNATTLGATTGSGAASGSILVSTSGAGVSVLQFRVYLRPDAAGGAVHTTDNSRHTGDAWLISLSELTPAPVATPNTLTFDNPGGTNSADVSNGFAGTDSQPGTLTSLTLTTFPTNATSITINGTRYTGATAFNAASVAARTLSTNGDGTLATGQTVTVDPLDGGRTSVLPFTVTDVQGATSAAANLNIIFTATSSGYVFEDVNYGGGAGRPFSTADTSPRSGATVELYNAATGAFVARTTTDATGKYTFNTLANTGYTVRVVNSTVTSSRNSNNVAGLVPVQTFNGTTNRVGGESPNLVDALANTNGVALSALTVAGSTTPESIASFNTGNNIGPDFGFNFDLVVNTNDVATVSGNNAQGSLRQFLLNSNALTGEAALAQTYTGTTGATTALTPGVEKSIFMIPNGQAIAGQRSGLVSGFTTTAAGGGSGTSATITLQAVLPNITGSFTSLDGSTQTQATGDSNAPVTTTGSEALGNEVFINFNNLSGFSTSAPSTSLLNLGLTNANTAGGSNMAAFGILAGATSAVVQNNTFYKSGANLRINNVGGANISNNISRDALNVESDGIEVSGSSNNMIAGNQFLNNAGFGIDFISGTSTGNAVTGNIFSRNGQNTTSSQTAGIGLRSNAASNNNFSNNIFTSNLGDGISAIAGTNNVFSQNSFSNNGDLAIDLANGAINGNVNGDGVTVNTTAATRTGANNLVNFPILTTASVGTTDLVLNGYARPGALVELYLAAADPTN
ncbi:MAG: hypothetical protein EOO60_02265, partial [Hymenobacter sp.]